MHNVTVSEPQKQERNLVRRINRKLKDARAWEYELADNFWIPIPPRLKLRKARHVLNRGYHKLVMLPCGQRAWLDLGEFYLVDPSKNIIVATEIRLTDFAARLREPLILERVGHDY